MALLRKSCKLKQPTCVCPKCSVGPVRVPFSSLGKKQSPEKNSHHFSGSLRAALARRPRPVFFLHCRTRVRDAPHAAVYTAPFVEAPRIAPRPIVYQRTTPTPPSFATPPPRHATSPPQMQAVGPSALPQRARRRLPPKLLSWCHGPLPPTSPPRGTPSLPESLLAAPGARTMDVCRAHGAPQGGNTREGHRATGRARPRKSKPLSARACGPPAGVFARPPPCSAAPRQAAAQHTTYRAQAQTHTGQAPRSIAAAFAGCRLLPF